MRRMITLMASGDQSADTMRGPAVFQTTHWTVALAAGRDSSPEARQSLEQLCQAYWFPLYSYLRRRGFSPADAEDLTQSFFALLLEKQFLKNVDPAKGRFRSFLLAALNHFVANEWDRARAVKRGGGRAIVSLDATDAEGRFLIEPATSLTPEMIFDRHWATVILERGLKNLREEFVAEGKLKLFESLKPFLSSESNSGDYDALAPALQMTPNAVAIAVCRFRRRFQELVREEVTQTVRCPEDVPEELRHLGAILTKII